MTSKEMDVLGRGLISDKLWRLSNLYKIKTKYGGVVTFEPNWAQLQLLSGMHYLNIILKARQLGITTLFSLLFLDTCLFNDNVHAAIIADNKDTAKEIFRDKVKFAYDNIPECFKQHAPAYRDNINELRFGNGSVFRVGTGLRGGTLQLLHITEFAKICVENPTKAAEIMSGALNTLQSGQFATMESTARGRDGDFYDMCKKAMSLQEAGKILSPLDWKFWFFSWHKHPDYILKDAELVIPKESEKYFTQLEDKGIILTDEQKAWYVKKEETQGEYMKREYPSTPEEAFETANQGYYFAALMAKARMEKRICNIAVDEYVHKFAVADIGWDDATALWTFQVVGKEIHMLDYYENSGESWPHYANWLNKLGYPINKIFLPHDAANKNPATGRCYADYVRDMGFKTEIIKKSENILVDIEMLRAFFPRLYFNQTKCVEGIKAVENYRKEWNEKKECFRERPFHNWATHGTSALIYAMNAVQGLIGNRGLSAEEWKRIRDKHG
jgi:hypothetical protein